MTSIPFLLAPRSPKPSYNDAFVRQLKERFTRLDQPRRTTGSLAHDDLEAGCALPPLISTSFKGEWVRSPWSKRPREVGETATGKTSEVDGLLAEEGIPLDLREVEARRKRVRSQEVLEDTQLVKVDLSRNGNGSGAGSGASTSASKVTSTSRQQSLASLGTSSKPGLASTSKPARPTSSAANAALRAQAPASEPAPRRASGSARKSATSPERFAVVVPKPGIPISPISKSLNTSGGSQSAQRDRGGRSLGEDEEVLFEQGCSQMVLPPTQPAVPASPLALARHSTGPIPTPSLPKDRATSTPFAARTAAVSAAPSPPHPPTTPPSPFQDGHFSKAATLNQSVSLPDNFGNPSHSSDRHLPRASTDGGPSGPAPQPSASAPVPAVPKVQAMASQQPRLLTSFPSSSQVAPDVDEDDEEEDERSRGRSSSGSEVDQEISAFLESDLRT